MEGPDVTTAELANATGLSMAGIKWNIRQLKAVKQFADKARG